MRYQITITDTVESELSISDLAEQIESGEVQVAEILTEDADIEIESL